MTSDPAVPVTQEQLTDAVRTLARLSRLLERSTGELSLAHYRVLSAVAAGEARASRVAARLALGKPTVSASVDSLCQRGLLTRNPVSSDQRAARLELTSAGDAALARVELEMIARIRSVIERTDTPGQVVGALADLGRALDEVPLRTTAGLSL
jgi:DNA-binding MarR family transcriptional regulator